MTLRELNGVCKRRRLGIGLLMAIGAGALSIGLGAGGKSQARLPFGNVGARRKTLELSNREVLLPPVYLCSCCWLPVFPVPSSE